MERRTLGGLEVTPLGFGAGSLGDASLDEDHVGRLLNEAADAGIRLFDTARSYGLSEERLGRHLSWRRADIVLSTKVGYGIPGHPDWTADCIEAGVDAALGRMQTDHIDIVHLHSCPVHVLEHHGVLEALGRARDQGKIGRVAYSGDNDALAYAVGHPLVDIVQTSVNVFDQWATDHVLEGTSKGVIAKRPLANAPWRFERRPRGHYAETYWERMRIMGLPGELNLHDVALRFALYHAGADVAIAGTTSLTHLHQNIAIAERGPLSEDVLRLVRSAFRDNQADWRSQT